MNKSDIKQIIVEEIESTLEEIAGGINIGGTFEEDMDSMSPEELIASTFFDEEGMDLEENEEDEKGKQGRSYNVFDIDTEKAAQLAPGFENMSDAEKKAEIGKFMIRVNNFLETYRPISKETGRASKRLKARFNISDLKNLLDVFAQGSFKSSDIIGAIESYKYPSQANKFLKALEMKGFITLTSGGKKGTSGSTYVPKTDRPKGAISLSDLGLDENQNNMSSNLEKYIRQQIHEATNPLAKKMKEIENQGRKAALETKLAAIAEMIEETNGRLTRIDEDEEFNEMMDKKKVKDIRKQLKELEKIQGKIQKEAAKLEGKMDKGMKSYKDKEVMDEESPIDEVAPENDVNLAREIEAELSEESDLEEETFELNESVKRMQKLANLKG